MTKRPTRRPTTCPDNAWLALVFRTMSNDDIRHEIENPNNDAAGVELLKAELTRRTKGAK